MKLDEYCRRLYKLLDRRDVQNRLPEDPSLVSGTVYGHYPPNSVAPAFRAARFDWSMSHPHAASVVLGHNPGRDSLCLSVAEKQQCPVILCEDGFVRSLDTYCQPHAPVRNRLSVSVVMDASGYYFDSSRPNRLTSMLNGPEELTPEQLSEARRFRRMLVEWKITKYNHQPLEILDVGRTGRRKVLVVDQVYGDFAITRGGASDETFRTMLRDACRENPDCDILVKTHPITATKLKGYYQGLKQQDNMFPVTAPCNPYALLEHVDDVYVCSSQLGFEALMAGKRVHVYGKPFYAGWGLTDDRQDMSTLRKRRRTVDDLVYFLYFRYTFWNIPDVGKPCSPFDAVGWVARNRPVRPPRQASPSCVSKVVLAVDNDPRARRWAAYAVDSIFNHCPPDRTIEVYMISLSPYNDPRVHWVDAAPYISQFDLTKASNGGPLYFTGNRPFPLATYFRLLIPIMKEFQDDARVVYMDVDTEVVDPRFFDMFDLPLDLEIAGVRDNGSKGGLRHWNSLLQEPDVKNFATRFQTYERLAAGLSIMVGAILLNLQRIRAVHPNYIQDVKAALELMRQKHLYADQDILNLLCTMRTIPSSFNSLINLHDKTLPCYLIHYAGKCKCAGLYPPPRERQALWPCVQYKGKTSQCD